MRLLAFLTFTLLLCFSCSKNPEKALSAVDGKWDVVYTYSSVDVIMNSYEEVWEFKKDGTGKWSDNYSSGTFKWSYENEHDRVVYFRNNYEYIYDVTKATRNSEQWELVSFDGFTPPPNELRMIVDLKRQR